MLLSLLLLLFTLFFLRVFPRARSLLHWFENFCSVHLLRVCQNRNYRRKFCLIYKSIDIRFYRCCCCCCGSPPSFSVYFPLSCHQLAASSSSLAWVDCLFFFLHKNRFLHKFFKLSWFRFGEFSPSRLKKLIGPTDRLVTSGVPEKVYKNCAFCLHRLGKVGHRLPGYLFRLVFLFLMMF